MIVIFIAIATLALQIRYGLVRQGDWKPSVVAMLWPYFVLIIAFIAHQFLRVPKLLYMELQTASRRKEGSLRAVISEQENNLHVLTEKPKPLLLFVI